MFNDSYLNAAVRFLPGVVSYTTFTIGEYYDALYSGPLYKDTDLVFVAPNKIVNTVDPSGFDADLSYLVGKTVSVEGATTAGNNITKLTVSSVSGGEMVISGASFSAESFVSGTRLFENITKTVMVVLMSTCTVSGSTSIHLSLSEPIGCGDGWNAATEQTIGGYDYQAVDPTNDSGVEQYEPMNDMDIWMSADTISLNYGVWGLENGLEYGEDSLTDREAVDTIIKEEIETDISLGSALLVTVAYTETAAFVGALSSNYVTTAEIEEVMLSGGAFSPATLFNAALEENIVAGAVLAGLGEFLAEVVIAMTIDSAAYSGVNDLPALDDGRRVWVVNLDNGATSQYENYGFTDIIPLDDGKYYGIANDGLYLLEGDDDNGATIDNLINFGKDDMGIANLKNCFNVYAGVDSDGTLYLQVTTDDGTSYTYEARSYGSLTNQRFDLGQGLKGVYWEFILISEERLELEKISFEPIDLGRKV